jgi:hypothetical protein
MVLKFVSNTTQRRRIWNRPNAAEAISREKHTSMFHKMATIPTEHIWRVLELAKNNSVVAVRRAFRRQLGRRGLSSSVHQKVV